MFVSVPANVHPTILKKCFRQIQQIPGLKIPVALDLKDANGNLITQVILDRDRLITDIQTGLIYKSPSRLRHIKIQPNTSTYDYLFFQGQSLASLGVGR